MHSDKTPSLSFFDKNRNAWNCFSCNKGGNAINLVREYYGLSFTDACVWLCQQYHIGLDGIKMDSHHYRNLVPSYSNTRTETESGEHQSFDSEVISSLLRQGSLTSESEVFLFEFRCLSPEVIAKLGIIGISEPAKAIDFLSTRFPKDRLINSGIIKETKGKLYLKFWTPCVVFPYNDVEGNLIGIQTRYIGFEENAPRFQFISGFNTSIFNLPEIKDMHEGDDLYISEGITDCLALLSSGKKAVAVPSASILPEIDLWRLRHFTLRMYPDNDAAGNKAYENILNKMVDYSSYVQKEELPLDCKDYSDYYLTQIGNNGKVF